MQRLGQGPPGRQDQGDGPRPTVLGHGAPGVPNRHPQGGKQGFGIGAHQDHWLAGRPLLQLPELGSSLRTGGQGGHRVGGE